MRLKVDDKNSVACKPKLFASPIPGSASGRLFVVATLTSPLDIAFVDFSRE